MLDFLVVCPLVFLAGFVDAVAGGGGVISLPAIIMALIGSWIGARLALMVDNDIFKIVMLVILHITAVFILNKKTLSKYQCPYSEGKTSSIIMERQHIYGRPPFDYAFTDGSFYVYDYLGDGDSIINFAMSIVGNEDLIQNITNSIDNGTITDTRSLDLYAENLQGKQRVNYRRFADAFKKRHGNRGYGVTFRGDSASNGGTYFEDSKRIGGDATTRGTSGHIDESANQELTTRFSLITPEMDASYLDAVNRGDMETAQRMVMEAAKMASGAMRLWMA